MVVGEGGAGEEGPAVTLHQTLYENLFIKPFSNGSHSHGRCFVMSIKRPYSAESIIPLRYPIVSAKDLFGRLQLHTSTVLAPNLEWQAALLGDGFVHQPVLAQELRR